MLQKENTGNRKMLAASLVQRMMQGAVVGLLVILVFLFSAGRPDPGWPRYWMAKPLLVVPVAGAMAGLYYYLMGTFRARGGWVGASALIISILGVLVALWLGIVVGLDGTYWD